MSNPRRIFPGRRFVSGLLCLCLGLGSAFADTARVIAKAANLRKTPGVSGQLLASLPHGTRLEVLGSEGDWLKVRVVEGGAEGFILRRYVETGAAATTPAAAPPAAAAPATVTPPPAPPQAEPGVRISHDDVGCVVAGQYPKLLACFSPEENLGRARVLFRAVGTDPWYYVDMSPEGKCHAAILPKPKVGTAGFQYYVHTLDRGFFQVQDPTTAPDHAFAPRVVKRQGECEAGRRVALAVAKLLKPVKVGVALDPSGGALAASAAGAPVNMPLTGFSTDGVELGGLGKSSGSGSSGAAGAAAGGAAAGGILGLPTIALVAGGVAVAGVGVAVAAGGGDSGGASAATGVTGHWAGRADQGAGLIYQFSETDFSCTVRYDVTLDLNQSGPTASGSAAIGARSFTCNVPGDAQDLVNQALAGVPRENNSYPVNGTANESGSTTLTIGGIPFTGSFSRTNMDLNGTFPTSPGISQFSMTLRVSRQ